MDKKKLKLMWKPVCLFSILIFSRKKREKKSSIIMCLLFSAASFDFVLFFPHTCLTRKLDWYRLKWIARVDCDEKVFLFEHLQLNKQILISSERFPFESCFNSVKIVKWQNRFESIYIHCVQTTDWCNSSGINSPQNTIDAKEMG